MRTKAQFEPLNAVTSGVKELRELIGAAKQRRIHENKKTIVFVDEIHRFNRAQQDALLPDVEYGNITLIGATTENPFFSVVAPLLSRSQIFEFKRLDEDALVAVLRRALAHPDLGFNEYQITVDDDALAHIARFAEGDTRRALNTLEAALLTTPPSDVDISSEASSASSADSALIRPTLHITLADARESTQRKLLHYDGTGDEHYDAASAFIKSMRGSNPDAALYWMARMLEAGETPRFIARRICIAAAEDIGNADPMALILATAAWQACEFIGLPEARILLAQTATYNACAPKSNAAYTAIDAAIAAVRNEATREVPNHLRDTHYQGAKRLARGQDYQYPHNDPDGYLPQDYGVPRGTYYHPTNHGKEAEFQDRLKELDERDATP
jgi:putative ATPase